MTELYSANRGITEDEVVCRTKDAIKKVHLIAHLACILIASILPMATTKVWNLLAVLYLSTLDFVALCFASIERL